MGTENKIGDRTPREITHRGRQKTEQGQVIFYITEGGFELARKIAGLYPDAEILKYNSGVFADRWLKSASIICIMATGIVVRTVASLLKDKKTDPAIVVLDEKGKYAISLLSGHIGGANELTIEIADYLNAQAVLTTASDVQGKVSLDVWALEKSLFIEDHERMKRLSVKIVNGNKIKVWTDCPVHTEYLPEEFIMINSRDKAEIIITNRVTNEDALFLRPKNLILGVGCNRGTSKEEIKVMVGQVFQREKLSFNSINNIATIDLKKDEQGLVDYAHEKGLNIDFFPSDELNNASVIYNISVSEVVMNATGAVAVAEPSAILSAKKIFHKCAIITPKEKRGNVTLAVAEAEFIL